MNSKLIEVPVKNTGLIVEEPKYENYHATDLFGAVGEGFVGTDSPLNAPSIIFPDGKGWLQVARDYGIAEKQYEGNFDSFHCVIYSIAKALCYYLFKVYGIKITISEMYNGFFAGVQPNRGTTIEKGMESFRKHGWISDEKYPFNPVLFFKEPPKTIQIEAEGELTEWEFHWEVLPRNLKAIFEAYKRTPVVLIGFAWASYYGEGVFFDNGNPSNHAFLGLEPKSNGNNIIDDTYPRDRGDLELTKDDMLKELHSTFNYGGAWRVWLTPKKNNKLTLITMLKKIARDIHGGFWFIKNNSKQKITDWKSLLGAIIDEIGVEENDLTDEQLEQYDDALFFGSKVPNSSKNAPSSDFDAI